MKGKLCFLIISIAIILGLAIPAAQAQDTSPYLMGYFTVDSESGHAISQYFIINPTTRPLSVYATFYDRGGNFLDCFVEALGPNNTWFLNAPRDNEENDGTVKFFAFPYNSTKFDPNAVIGGFHRYIECENLVGYHPMPADQNLKAVTINSSTLAEFQMGVLQGGGCITHGDLGKYIDPVRYCANLENPE